MASLSLPPPSSEAVKICIVGECFGENESTLSFPFVGKAGAELYRMLCEAGFPLAPISHIYPGSLMMKVKWQEAFSACAIHLTNVFNFLPEGGKIESLLAKKNSGTPLAPSLPLLRPGLYLKEEFLPSLTQLHSELLALKPNLILAVGNTACWALLQTTKISTLRGTIAQSPFGKILPTYHPAAVLRNYELRPITVTDLYKAFREMDSPTFTRKYREIWVEPSIKDLWDWWETYGVHSDLLSVDIETERATQISEIGMASDSSHALHIPFIVNRTKSYWKSAAEEVEAWNFIRHVMASSVEKVGQNFLYDFQYLWKKVGIPVYNFTHDTMLLHHALFPGMQKSLGFLGSIYTDEPSWKTLRREGNKDDD